MIVKYFIGWFIGQIIASVGFVNIIIILRFGLPMCNHLIKQNDTDEIEKKALKNMKSNYFLCILIWSIIIIIVSIVCYKFLDNAIWGYIIAILFTVITGFGATGNTPNNVSDFYNTLKNQTRKLY